MNLSQCHTSTWLNDSQLTPYVDAFTQHLFNCRYASNTIGNYLAGLAHFAHWTTLCNIDVKGIDEKLIHQFLDDHLLSCNCERPVFLARKDLSAALGHLLVLLRAHAVVADPAIGLTPVDEELRRFDEYMNRVRGPAPQTRKHSLAVIRRLLLGQFADQAVVISAIQPAHIRQFVLSQSELCKVPASISATISALRSYFRYRTTQGDSVHHLIGVTSYPANWQQASLPKTLADNEIERLLAALVHDGAAARRTAAIVHCALDLGLRSSEVAYLGLDDIDWSAATITLRHTKGRRDDVMPLHHATSLSALTSSVNRYARLMPAQDCLTHDRTFCGTPWPADYWRVVVHLKKWPMCFGTARSIPLWFMPNSIVKILLRLPCLGQGVRHECAHPDENTCRKLPRRASSAWLWFAYGGLFNPQFCPLR
jgi:integrase/recombinase XerC